MDKRKKIKKLRIYEFGISVVMLFLSLFSTILIFISFQKYDKSKYLEISGIVEKYDDLEEDYRAIKLVNVKTLYRIIPVSEDIIKTKEIKERVPIGSEVTITYTSYKKSTTIFNIMGIKSGENTILNVDDMINRLKRNDLEARIVGISLVIFCFSGSVISLFIGILKRKNRVLGEHGERIMSVQYLDNNIEVFLASNKLKDVVLIINNNLYNCDGNFQSKKCIFNSKIQTLEGEKNIYLNYNIWGKICLYCEETLLAKKKIFLRY